MGTQQNNSNRLKVAIWRKMDTTEIPRPLQLIRKIRDKGAALGEWGEDILRKSIFRHTGQFSFTLVLIRVGELGFQGGASLHEIYEKTTSSTININAIRTTVRLCSNEVGPLLRLQYTNQPENELIYIAMAPIVDSHGCKSIFSVANSEGKLFLGGGYGDSSSFYNPSSTFAFELKG